MRDLHGECRRHAEHYEQGASPVRLKAAEPTVIKSRPVAADEFHNSPKKKPGHEAGQNNQYSSGSKMVVTERSHSVMIQNFVPSSVW